MMLIIDTTDKECRVSIYDGRNIESQKWFWRKDTGTEVLRNIQKLFEKRKKNLKDIKTIAVNQGPGSYTGTRVGITIANTLGWTLNVPVLGYTNKKTADITRSILRKFKNGQLSPGHFPTPKY